MLGMINKDKNDLYQMLIDPNNSTLESFDS